MPFEQSGNFTYCFAAAGSVHKFKIVVAPTCLHVKQNSRRCSTVALCRVEETSRRVAQCVCAVGGVAVTGTSVFLDDVCRCLRNFVKVFASAGGVELRFRGAKMVSIAARTGFFGEGVASILGPHVFTVGGAWITAESAERHRRSRVEPNDVAVVVGVGIGNFECVCQTIPTCVLGVGVGDEFRKFRTECTTLQIGVEVVVVTARVGVFPRCFRQCRLLLHIWQKGQKAQAQCHDKQH